MKWISVGKRAKKFGADKPADGERSRTITQDQCDTDKDEATINPHLLYVP